MFVKDRPTKIGWRPVFRGCWFSKGLCKRNKEGAGRDFLNRPILRRVLVLRGAGIEKFHCINHEQ